MIAPSVEGVSTLGWRRGWLVAIAALSMALGGVLTGLLVSIIGRWIDIGRQPMWSVLLLLLGIAACCGDIREWFGVPVPTGHWLVPRWWRHFPPPTYQALFGMILGMGWLTKIPFASYYLLVIVVLHAGDVTFGSIAMGSFGLARSIPLVVFFIRSHASSRPMRTSAHLLRRREQLRRLADATAMRGLRTIASVGVIVWMWLLR